MTKSNKGFNLYFLIILGILLAMIWYTSLSSSDNDYTKGMFLKDLQAGNVTRVLTQPNVETPTGVVSVEKKSGEVSVLYVTDVEEVQAALVEYGIDPLVKDIPRENWFLSYVLPLLSVVAVGLLLFFIMNAQNSSLMQRRLVMDILSNIENLYQNT